MKKYTIKREILPNFNFLIISIFFMYIFCTYLFIMLIYIGIILFKLFLLMETTVITSSIMWPIMLLLWIGLFINTKHYKEIATGLKANRGLMVLFAILWMVTWSFLVQNHNLFHGTTEMIIFFVWCIMLLKASFMLALPQTVTKLISKVKYSSNLLKTFWLVHIIFWLYLINFAYYWV